MKEKQLLVPASLLSHTRTGAIVTVKGDDGNDYRGRVETIEGGTARIRVFETLPFPSESHLHITLLQGVPKKERMESIIRRATELGVSTIIPCRSARSGDTGRAVERVQDKSHRWAAIALKAVEQCRRRTVPVVEPPVEFRRAVAEAAPEALKLILYEKEKGERLKSVLAHSDCPAGVILACGPEGGFTEEETAFTRQMGFLPVRIGARIMRCETATVSALSIIQYALGDLG